MSTAQKMVDAIEQVLKAGPRTRDLGGEAATGEVGDAIAARPATA